MLSGNLCSHVILFDTFPHISFFFSAVRAPLLFHRLGATCSPRCVWKVHWVPFPTPYPKCTNRAIRLLSTKLACCSPMHIEANRLHPPFSIYIYISMTFITILALEGIKWQKWKLHHFWCFIFFTSSLLLGICWCTRDNLLRAHQPSLFFSFFSLSQATEVGVLCLVDENGFGKFCKKV